MKVLGCVQNFSVFLGLHLIFNIACMVLWRFLVGYTVSFVSWVVLIFNVRCMGL